MAAKIVRRPQEYRWSSYPSYLKGKGIIGLKYDTILGYFSGGRARRLLQYREFVEGEMEKKEQWGKLQVLKGIFIGDEDFVEEARKRATKDSNLSGHYSLKRIVQNVSKVIAVAEEEIRRPIRREEVQRAREVLCYVCRRHSDVGLGELARFLGVKELSTPSHGVKRAERRIQTDRSFARQVDRVLAHLGHSSIQA